MKEHLESYDHIAVGKRILRLRESLGLTREDMAEAIGRAPKYYADIERGTCGMSVETLLAIREHLGVSLDYLLLGEQRAVPEQTGEERGVIQIIHTLPETKRAYILESIKLLARAYTEKSN